MAVTAGEGPIRARLRAGDTGAVGWGPIAAARADRTGWAAGPDDIRPRSGAPLRGGRAAGPGAGGAPISPVVGIGR
jgi:hypothetical protein